MAKLDECSGIHELERARNSRMEPDRARADQATPFEACYLDWQESLAQLAKLVEPVIPGP